MLILLFSVLLLPVSAEEPVADQSDVVSDETSAETSETVETIPLNQELRDSEDYNTTKGSFYDTVYTLWYWIFGDSFTTSDKVCCILSVITIVWMIYLLIPARRR